MFTKTFLLPTVLLLLSYLVFPFSLSVKQQALSLFKFERTMSGTSTTGAGTETTTGVVGEWVKTQFTTLFASSEESPIERFHSTFEDTFTHAPKIKYNDDVIELAELRERLEGARFKVQSADVRWRNVAEHAAEGEDQTIVFGSFSVTRLSKLRIRAGPAEHTQSVSFEARVEKESGEVHEGGSGERGGGDAGFRIAESSITSEDEAAPVIIASIPGQTS